MVSFRRFVITALLALALFTGAAFGQTAIPATDRHAVGYLGGSYNPQGSPKAALNLGGFYSVMDDDKLYVGAAINVNWKPNGQPKFAIRPEALPLLYTWHINGVALPIRGIVGIGAQIEPSDPVATVANLRAALSNVGANYGISAALGATTSILFYKGLAFSPSFRWIGGDGKPAKIVGAGIAWRFSVRADKQKQ